MPADPSSQSSATSISFRSGGHSISMENIGAQKHSRTKASDVRYHKSQMDRKDLRALSRVRLSEARALLKAGLPDGAYYLAGYAAECALKACIAKETRRYEFPEKKRVSASHTHDLADLVKVAELQD